MSKTETKPTDEAYIVAYERDRVSQRALIIAGTPYAAKRNLLDHFDEQGITGISTRSLHIKGILRDNVSEAQDTGVSLL